MKFSFATIKDLVHGGKFTVASSHSERSRVEDMAETLYGVALGKSVTTRFYGYDFGNAVSLQEFFSQRDFHKSRYYKSASKTFSQLALACKGTCMNEENGALFGQTRFNMIIPKQDPFYQSFEFWNEIQVSISTVRYHKFFGQLVQSRVYDWILCQQAKLQRFMGIRDLNEFVKGIKNNGSLFSFVFMADENQEYKNEERPTTLKALTGTFFITVVMICVSVLIALVECRKLYLF
ncbi:unnamed protein product [Orchesella dallaii]|uniref:Uncharacterized protein n=1 Tax=Orchesella dallaii TaxID=48710 RepID=A0ABP1RLT1_9HEXA